jgi:hypothetical protein
LNWAKILLAAGLPSWQVKQKSIAATVAPVAGARRLFWSEPWPLPWQPFVPSPTQVTGEDPEVAIGRLCAASFQESAVGVISAGRPLLVNGEV